MIDGGCMAEAGYPVHGFWYTTKICPKNEEATQRYCCEWSGWCCVLFPAAGNGQGKPSWGTTEFEILGKGMSLHVLICKLLPLFAEHCIHGNVFNFCLNLRTRAHKRVTDLASCW